MTGFLDFAESCKKMNTDNDVLKAENRKYKVEKDRHVAEQEVAKSDISRLQERLRASDATIKAQKADIKRLEDRAAGLEERSKTWKRYYDMKKEELRVLTTRVKQKKARLLLEIEDIE
jgi:chromosome segregation ATPase